MKEIADTLEFWDREPGGLRVGCRYLVPGMEALIDVHEILPLAAQGTEKAVVISDTVTHQRRAVIIEVRRDEEVSSGTCRMCGCTDEMACVDLNTGLPCHWRTDDPTVCSCCDPLGGPGMALRSWPLPEPKEGALAEEDPVEGFDVLNFDDAVYEEAERMVSRGVTRSELVLEIDAEIRRGIAQTQIDRDRNRGMNTWQGMDLVELREDRGGYWNVRRKA